MSKVYASFDSIDAAGIASMRLKSSLKTIKDIDVRDDPSAIGRGGNGNDYFLDGSSADTRFGDYFNYGMQFNNFGPFSSPWHREYGYFEPKLRSDTRVTVSVDSSEIKTCQSILRSLGGTKINIISD